MKLRFFAVALYLIFVSWNSFSQEVVTLEKAITLALEKNYDVLTAENARELAKTNNDYAWGAFLPQVTGTATNTYAGNEQDIRFDNEANNRAGRNQSNGITAGAQLSWVLFDGTRMFSARQTVDAVETQSELLLKNQMVNTIAQVITSYYDIVRQKQQLKAIQEQMSVSEERVKLAERKLQVGTGIKPELLQARVDYNAQRTQVLQQISSIAQLKQLLNVTVGEQLPKDYEVADSIIIDLNLNSPELFENIENKNFALLAGKESLRIANLGIKQSRANYFPFLTFNAGYSYSQTDNTKQISPFGPIYNKTQGYNYGLTLSLPILNGFSTRLLNQTSKLNFQQATVNYNLSKANINAGLNNAFVAYDNAKQILVIEEETIGLAKENVYIALEGFKRGVTTFIELRTAQQSLADAYNRLIAARYNTKLAETELLRLSGALLK